ncbi:MAG: hypothetical protein ABJJ37_02065, partial [Roseibium sp.]
MNCLPTGIAAQPTDTQHVRTHAHFGYLKANGRRAAKSHSHQTALLRLAARVFPIVFDKFVQVVCTTTIMAAANPCYSESLEEPSRFDFYGQINRGILSFNDGQDQGTYVFVDNSKSVSRLGVTFDSSLQNDWRVQAVGEIGLIRKQINSISQTNPSDSDFEFGKRSLRKLD